MHQISPHAVDAPRPHTGTVARNVLLAADVGGTHARIGLVRADAARSGEYTLTTLGYRQYACADYPSLAAILSAFLGDTSPQPAAACIACAGYVHGDALVNANLPWPVSATAIARELGIDRVDVVNDFEALAYAAHYAAHADSIHIAGDAALADDKIRLALGPGTGLGAAVLIPGSSRPSVLSTEAGHAALAPRTALEHAILRHLGGEAAHVPNERVLSGPGLLHLYGALCAIRAVQPKFETPAQITQAALAANDALATETVDVFCAWLGSLIGDLVMLFDAFGGVILAGGVLPQIVPLLQRSAFTTRLADKGVLHDVLARVPVRLIEHGQLGVTGAARWYFDHAQDDIGLNKRDLETGGNTSV
ncbi:MAG: ROK family protein [Gammaproteobacteria bacterium]|nr:MAG: ROK family protein [Gammaproteobacteria bacterium]